MPNADRPTRAAVIFDLDGTLIDTLDDIADSLNLVLERSGRARLSRAQVRSIVGEGLASLVRRAAGVAEAVELAPLVAQYRAIYRERMFLHTRPYPGIPDMLDALAASGAPMSILSNKSHEFTVPMCENLLSRWSFAGVLGAMDEATRKPDPRNACELARSMRHEPRNVWMVGDSSVDVQTGRNAGMRTIAVTWGLRDRDELVAAAPDALIDHPSELVPIVLAR